MKRDAEHDWDELLEQLQSHVHTELAREPLPSESDMLRLARDYESFVRMEHPPLRARRLAEQLLFQQRRYADETLVRQLGIRVTIMLASIYRDWLQTGGSGSPNQSGQ
ncbi:hypothetical protein [Natronospira bacteriovora]|uniref:Uncharacterized protein n=1 Tax=Natronospira bacteriovora TaxID=3069753 RepID=A0ABU0W346_9GAMM|nr:hypothetical protein [Natronospira sp. AB-CW4]MDQ2068391.1 hypothetical protein [Natronospira sp. AB-CW4]